MNISIHTVSFHLKNIYEKHQVYSKTEAVAKALRENIVGCKFYLSFSRKVESGGVESSKGDGRFADNGDGKKAWHISYLCVFVR